MKSLQLTSASLSVVCILALTTLPRATGQPAAASDAKALLAEAQKNLHERKRAAKQKELDRMIEDGKKGKQEAADLEQSISKVANAVAGAKSSIDQIAGRKKSATQDLELLGLRAEAERLKAEGLSLLNAANGKALEALTRRNEELDLKTAIISAEIQKATDDEIGADSEARKLRSESGPSLTELRKNLGKAQSKTSLADYRAHEAMDAASRKLAQAEAAAAKVEKRQAEFDAEKTSGTPAASAPAKPKAKKDR
jgi:hypothetical protein